MPQVSPPPLPPRLPAEGSAASRAALTGGSFWTPVAMGVLVGMAGVFGAGSTTAVISSGAGEGANGFSTQVARNDVPVRFGADTSSPAAGGTGGDAGAAAAGAASGNGSGGSGGNDSGAAPGGSPGGAETSSSGAGSGEGTSGADTAGSRGSGSRGSGNSARGTGGRPAAGSPAGGTPAGSGAQPPSATPPSAPSGGRPLDDVRARQNLLPVAAATAAGSALCAITVPDPAQVELSLAGSEFRDKSGARLTLMPSTEEGIRRWSVEQNAATGLGKPQDCGAFSFQDGQLRYQPGSDGTSLLPFCLLKISAGSGSARDTEICRLWQPLVSQDVSLTFEGNRLEQPLFPDELPSLPVESLTVTLAADGFGDSDFPDGDRLTSGKPIVLEVFDPELAGELLFSVRLSLEEQSSGRAALVISYVATVPTVQIRNLKVTTGMDEVPLSRPGLERIAAEAEKEIAAIQNLVDRKVQPEIEKYEKAIDQQKNNRAAAGQARAQKELEKLQETLDELDEAIIMLDDLIVWAETAAAVCQDLESDARLSLKVVRKTRDGHEILLLETGQAGG